MSGCQRVGDISIQNSKIHRLSYTPRVTFSPPYQKDWGWGFSKSPWRNFLLHWSRLDRRDLHPPIPGNDTSTGSFEFRDAPPELCTRNKKFCTTKPNWFYAPMVSCWRNLSRCNALPIVKVLYRSQSLHCSPGKPVRLCQSGQWLADKFTIAFIHSKQRKNYHSNYWGLHW
jgi:hypothetical protein